MRRNAFPKCGKSPSDVRYDGWPHACTRSSPRTTVVFDAAYFRRRDPEQVRAAIWHMLAEQRPAMPHLRSALSDAEARAIITYLRQTE